MVYYYIFVLLFTKLQNKQAWLLDLCHKSMHAFLKNVSHETSYRFVSIERNGFFFMRTKGEHAGRAIVRYVLNAFDNMSVEGSGWRSDIRPHSYTHTNARDLSYKSTIPRIPTHTTQFQNTKFLYFYSRQLCFHNGIYPHNIRKNRSVSHRRREKG